MLHGWRWNTLLSYNAGVKKFLRFKKVTSNKPSDLLASSKDHTHLIGWDARSVGGPMANDIYA
ncbi:hypothetical protein Pst134EB_021899 [Puccinia striiformis f. sp. tritici]|nr:hypothetical protein Pst134EB_021899 [Puccinia striiformis f. sp. tritici]